MKYTFRAEIIDDDTEKVIAEISSFTEEGLEEEMGKSKWSKAIERNEEEKRLAYEAEQEIRGEDIEEKVGELGELE